MLTVAMVTCASGIVGASSPILSTETACVVDDLAITPSGFLLTILGVDLAPLAGKRIRVTGYLQPGD